jgi:small conductance mechanosensitive channel
MNDLFTGSFWEDVWRVLLLYWERLLLLFPRFFIALLILAVAWFLAGKVKLLFDRKIQRNARDPLLVRYLSVISKYAVIIVGLLLALNTIGLRGVAAGILAGAGISALIFGFAFKDIAENFLAGAILAFDRPFDINDTISIKGISGVIVSLNLRTTHLRTFDSQDVFIPNATILKSEVTNMTKNGLLRNDFKLEVAIADAPRMEEIKQEIAALLLGQQEIFSPEPPYVVTEEISAGKAVLRVYFWTETLDYRKDVIEVKSRIITKVKDLMYRKGYWKV